ncbi:MAG: FAD-binding protein [Erysipelotrichaceae bacterium]
MKNLFKVLLASLLALSLVGCSAPTQEENEGITGVQTYEVTGNGYGGVVNLSVSIDGETITDIVLNDHAETNVVIDRAFPIIKERILEANTAVVDSVSAATFSSYAVKAAVADAMGQAGIEVEAITFATSGAEHEAVTLEDVTADIVIVGGGPAGLSAAIAAKQTNADANVILVEKLDILSGNGKFDMNFFDMINSEAQANDGREVTIETFIESKSSSTESAERIEVWANEAASVDAWLRDFGVELNYAYGGETSTSHMAEANQYAGEVIQAGLEAEAYNLGVDIRTGTEGGELIFDEGTVIGVNVTNNDNESYNIMASSTIIATGGFCNNTELLAEYAPGQETFVTSNQMGTTGDYVKLFEDYGFLMENMSTMSVFTNILSPEKHLTGGADLAFRVDATGTTAPTSNQTAYYITDTTGYDSFYRIQKHVASGYYEEATSIAELAGLLGVDAEGLQATIDAYNASVAAGEEGFEGKREFDAEGTYYGAVVVSANHMTKGGVTCNEAAQVLSVDGSIVDGLYAAGEVTSQSGAYAASVVFGKVAGEHAAATLTK